jgi:RNA polymerase sigma factor (sigma-70 family)
MLHHDPHHQQTLHEDRLSSGARGRLPADTTELERTVWAAAASSRWGWATLIDRFGARVRSVARRHGLGPQDIDDVAQTTWLSLFEHIGELREPRAVGGWLETTARRESLRVLRTADRERATDDEHMHLVPVEPVNERRLVAAEQRGALQASLSELPGRQCALIRTMLCEPARPYTEIARSLGIPPGSIGPTRIRSLDRLRADASLAALYAD